jgi:cell division initiation protein
MDLSSKDINEKEFHDAWRGYNQSEVDDFLDRVAETVDRLQRENADLTKRVAELDQAVAASRETEKMLQRTLLTAQHAAEEAIGKARAQAEELINEAEARVQSSENDARERMNRAEVESRRRAAEAERDLADKRREFDERVAALRNLEGNIKQGLKSFLEQHLRAVEGLESSPGGGPPADAAPAARPAAASRAPQPRPASSGPAAALNWGSGHGSQPGDSPGARRAEPHGDSPGARRAEPPGDSPGDDRDGSAPDDEVPPRPKGFRDFLRKQA